MTPPQNQLVLLWTTPPPPPPPRQANKSIPHLILDLFRGNGTRQDRWYPSALYTYLPAYSGLLNHIITMPPTVPSDGQLVCFRFYNTPRQFNKQAACILGWVGRFPRQGTVGWWYACLGVAGVGVTGVGNYAVPYSQTELFGCSVLVSAMCSRFPCLPKACPSQYPFSCISSVGRVALSLFLHSLWISMCMSQAITQTYSPNLEHLGLGQERTITLLTPVLLPTLLNPNRHFARFLPTAF